MYVDIDDPIQVSSSSSPDNAPEPNPEQIAMLADMGFTSAQARKALRATVREISWSSIT
jgi:ubiquitin carboxyl-terminal hydrolase 5/13